MYSTLICLAAAIAPSQKPLAPVHYRFDMSFSQQVDYTPIGGPVQEASASLSAFVTLVERDTVGGRIAEIKFDSIKVAPSDNLPGNLAGDPAPAKGVVYRAMLVNGRPMGGFKTTTVQPHANLFQSAFDALFPGFPASAKVADRWTDTVPFKDNVPIEKETTNIVTWTATALANGQLSMTGVVNGKTRTVQDAGGAQLVATGTITGTRQMVGTVGDAAISGTIATKLEISGSIDGGDPFPVKSDNKLTITRLP